MKIFFTITILIFCIANECAAQQSSNNPLNRLKAFFETEQQLGANQDTHSADNELGLNTGLNFETPNHVVEVYFVSNRDSDEGVSFGRCQVNYRVNTLTDSSVSGLNRMVAQFVGDRGFEVASVESLPRQQWFDELADDNVVVFVHGYNCGLNKSFSRAAMLQARWPDRKVIVFSWPSRGRIHEYFRDQTAATNSIPVLAKILEKLDQGRQANAEPIDVIAHSMGCRIIMGAVATFEKEQLELQLGQIILAAADVRPETFCDEAKHMEKYCDGLTCYCSKLDQALRQSRTINRYQPIGLVPPEGFKTQDYAQIHFVNVDQINDSKLGHSYCVSDPSVIWDMEQFLSEKPATLRPGPSSTDGLIILKPLSSEHIVPDGESRVESFQPGKR